MRTGVDSVFPEEYVKNLWGSGYIDDTQDSLSLEDFKKSSHDNLSQNIVSIINNNSNKFVPLRSFVSLH